MNALLSLILPLVAPLGWTGPAGPDPSFAVTRADFTRVAMVPTSYAAGSGLVGRASDGSGEVAINASSLLSIARLGEVPPPAPDGGFVLIRRDGGRLAGRPGAIVDDALEWSCRSLPGSRVPLAEIASIRAEASPDAAAAATASQDELRLTNGDAVVGVIAGSSAEQVTCQTSDGQRVPVEWKNVRLVRFAKTGGNPTSRPAPTHRVELLDGSRLDVADPRLADKDLSVYYEGRSISINLADVIRLDNLAGRTRLLSELRPTASSYAPYFPRAAILNDAPSKISSVVAANDAAAALPAPPRWSTTWTLPVAGGTFHARYVIAAGLTRADVTVRVRADDRVIFEKSHVRAGPASPPIDVPLGEAKSLKLEVDYGDGYDVQDEFFWLDAAVIGPATTP